MALEHFTAILAHELLADPRHLAGADEDGARLWIASCVVKPLTSSASLGGAPSRKARTLSTKNASPFGKVADSASYSALA
jgi:hypothetical protein